jgi:hypothetical protein
MGSQPAPHATHEHYSHCIPPDAAPPPDGSSRRTIPSPYGGVELNCRGPRRVDHDLDRRGPGGRPNGCTYAAAAGYGHRLVRKSRPVRPLQASKHQSQLTEPRSIDEVKQYTSPGVTTFASTHTAQSL